ncbi:PLD nuclease N-terminal domain-containing protein [Streptomyces sp. NBS 14/10]|uniref:PLD nuclease N-terminal domain-containing protein n=1 Tax=Streptomyces sp. NBS 14/10 TaxID=1945643 RepID=UPI000B7FC8C2|nr:PLD nuclease N-terminal domain-containing protein [Streptomyces sp. NBS 14/10]KAK1180109.1 PLD nuclease N-terminal domain-containing protein [Streptomyces sp. NBS 14/10]NUP42683.1 PLDc_N domain-containing protein [Streptomyces sp.]NUS82481.1 PLDc_N domain-containing protein [Streptomyces sp.]
MLRYLPFLLILALWIYAFIDCLNTPEEEVRHLPKVVWVIIVLLFGEVLIGPIAWLVAGKNRTAVAGGGAGGGSRSAAGPQQQWVAPDDNPEFLKSLREENKKDDEELLKDWEADLRRREEELRRKNEEGSGDAKE